MNLDKIAEERLFQNNSKEDIIRWSRDLKYFYYMRSRGGHNCEGDAFCTYLKYTDFDDLSTKLAQIGVVLNHLDEESIVFDPTKSYSLYDLDQLKITISQFKDIEQPQHTDIFGYKVHIWVLANCFEISISGTKKGVAYKVSDEDFNICLSLENEFDKLGWESIIDDSIKAEPHCISDERYPELFVE